MEQTPCSEADIFSPSQKIPHVLRNPGFPYRVHDSSPHVPTLSRFNPFHCPSSCSRAVLILSCLRLGLPSVLFLQFCPPKPVSVSAVPLTCHMPRPFHSSWFLHPNNAWWAVQTVMLFGKQCSQVCCNSVPLRPTYLPQSHSLCSSSTDTPRCTAIQNHRHIIAMYVLI